MDADLKEHILCHSLEGFVVTDLQGTILQCNATAIHLLGYRESELVGQFVGFIFPPRSISHLLPNLLHLALAGGGFEGEIILQDSEGENVMVRMNARAWPGPNPKRLILRFLDWRETHRVIEQLRESSQMASLGTLTRSLSHEILNPVTVIGVHTRRLLDSLQSESMEEEWARQLLAGVDKLEAIIQTINTFLNLPAPSFEKGSLHDLVSDSLADIGEEAGSLGIRISWERCGKLPSIYMDPELLKQSFTAVLLNAVDRMPNGGDLTLAMSCSDGLCHVNFEDSGPTLDAMQMEEDLSPIHIIGAHRTHLNLAISKRIVDEHGGRFEIGRSAAAGLKVKITLPMDRRALAREREM